MFVPLTAATGDRGSDTGIEGSRARRAVAIYTEHIRASINSTITHHTIKPQPSAMCRQTFRIRSPTIRHVKAQSDVVTEIASLNIDGSSVSLI